MSVVALLQAASNKPKRSSLFVGGRLLQRKLIIGASNDPLEQEADRVADQVMAMPERSAIGSTGPNIQRLTGHLVGSLEVAPASVDQVLGSTGRPLEPVIRQDMERRFGHDFSKVRVHTDATVGQSARDINAKAYTVGHRIVFGADRYKPSTQDGRRLIAHELTHVVQQSTDDSMNFYRKHSKKDLPRNFNTHRIPRALASRGAKVIQRATVEDCPSNIHSDVVIDFHNHAARMLGWALGLSFHTDMKVVRDAAWLSFHIVPQDPKVNSLWDRIQRVLGSITMHCGEAIYECEPSQSVLNGYCASGVVAVALDHIHLCPRWWMKKSKDHAAAILIHEWAHKWGPGVNRVFETYCSSSGYRGAPPEDTIRQPDAYANFAHQVWTGRPLPSC
jgi:hypothetical protein